MEQKTFGNRMQRFFTKWNLLLLTAGVTINFFLSVIVDIFRWPLHLDVLGTILVGALGGIVPGMAVGLLSIGLKSLIDPLGLYYAILAVIIGALSTVFSEKRYLKTRKGWLLTSLAFVAIAGIGGVTITWFVYGASIGGTSAPIGNWLVSHGFMPYFAQLLADLVVEIPDKLMMTGAACLIIKYIPTKIMEQFPLGNIYLMKDRDFQNMKKYRKSISRRITYIIMGSVAFISLFSILIFLLYYMQNIKNSSETFAKAVSKQEAGYVNGDKISQYLHEGDSSVEYQKVEKDLQILYNNADQVKYMFVYAIYEDGVHVVFDLDTPDMQGDEPGTVLTQQQGISSEYIDFLHGEEIPMEYTNGSYGNVLTVYSRILDSKGNTAAYAGVDIDMDVYFNQFAVFAIQVVTIIFAMSLLIFTFIMWYINKNITIPIEVIVHQTEQLKNLSPETWLESEAWKNQISLNTQDELEQLNRTVNELEEQASKSMKRVIETEQELLQTRELEEINKKLEAAVKNAEDANQAKTEFLSRMSHDMRTPLNGIMNLSEFILVSNTLDEAKKYGEKIHTSGTYLETLINDTLGMSRIESGKVVLKPEPHNYEEFEQSLKNVLDQKAEEKGVTLRFSHTVDLNRTIRIDLLRLQQICINLLNNAIKFTPKGGIVEFHTDCISRTDKEEILQFSVTDTGIGMSKEFVDEKLFQPFAQEHTGNDNEQTGTGLGLSIAKRLVDIMGGMLHCKSELGEGTEFTIRLPVIFAEEKAQKDVKQPVNLEKLKNCRILLCEDHALNREIAIKLLEKMGCLIETAKNGKEGLEKFKQHDSEYDLILMDIRMPVMDGIEATKAIRSLKIAEADIIPIIAMTANAYEDDRKECLKAGMNAHIAKPINPTIMYETIAQVIE